MKINYLTITKHVENLCRKHPVICIGEVPIFYLNWYRNSVSFIPKEDVIAFKEVPSDHIAFYKNNAEITLVIDKPDLHTIAYVAYYVLCLTEQPVKMGDINKLKAIAQKSYHQKIIDADLVYLSNFVTKINIILENWVTKKVVDSLFFEQLTESLLRVINLAENKNCYRYNMKKKKETKTRDQVIQEQIDIILKKNEEEATDIVARLKEGELLLQQELDRLRRAVALQNPVKYDGVHCQILTINKPHNGFWSVDLIDIWGVERFNVLLGAESQEIKTTSDDAEEVKQRWLHLKDDYHL